MFGRAPSNFDSLGELGELGMEMATISSPSQLVILAGE